MAIPTITASLALRRLIYLSRARIVVDAGVIDGIVAGSIPRNGAADITGALLYSSGHFLQWLEGPTQALGELMASIHADARHDVLRLIVDGPSSQRKFFGWSMLKCLADEHYLSSNTFLPELESAGVAERLFDLSRPAS